MAFDLAAELAKRQPGGESRQYRLIDVNLIDEDPRNFYNTSRIESLVNSISVSGVRQPLDVRPDPEHPGRYIAISGHRRRKAVLQLVGEGREDLRQVPCVVDGRKMTDAESEMLLLCGNADTRQLTDVELRQQAERMKDLIYQLKEQGYEFPGRVRDIVAEACHTTGSKLARLDAIHNNLKDGLYSQYAAGEMNESIAYTLCQLTGCEQDYFWHASEGKPTFWRHRSADAVKRAAAEMDKATSVCNSIRCPDGSLCGHHKARMQKAAGTNDGTSSLFCSGCCRDCSILSTCAWCCEAAKPLKQEQRQTAKEAEAEAARRRADAEKPIVDYIRETWQRVAQRAFDLDIDGSSWLGALNGYTTSFDDLDAASYRNRKKTFDKHDNLPGGIRYGSTARLAAAAEILDCSADFLLGLTAEPKPTAAAAGWQTGKPETNGRYLCRIKRDNGTSSYFPLMWLNDKWLGSFGKVTHWIPEVTE